jgi:transcriptional regulator with XRE-family HTH domain
MVTIRPKVEQIDMELARRGWSRREFARRLKTPEPYLSAIMRGHQEPGLELRNRMLAVLQKQFDEIFDAAPDKELARR